MTARNNGRIFQASCLLAFALGIASPAGAAGPAPGQGPAALALDLGPADGVPSYRTAPLDQARLATEDLARDRQGMPYRFAEPEDVSLTPRNSGAWTDLADGWRLWRLRVQAPDARSLNFGFYAYRLPKGARLSIYPSDIAGQDDPRLHWTFTDRDNAAHGELWTPVVKSGDVMVELLLAGEPGEVYELEIGSINRGYRELFAAAGDKSGTCNVDVVCPEGDPWWDEINSVGVFTLQGYWTCSGAMINNTAQDLTPYFLTANHCGITTGNDHTMVVYWNFQSPLCGQQGGGSLADNQTGATHLASGFSSDFCLVRLDASPNPDWNVTYAGWDRTTDDPLWAVAIHHPATDEKSISFEYDPTSTTSYYDTPVPGDGTHLRITDWDLGTTEPGSSGSPLFNPEHRIVGQLHGGLAACNNDESDWYGRLSYSFPSLEPYLDPAGTGAQVLNTLDPHVLGLSVSPREDLVATGERGGPFTPASKEYLLANGSGDPLDFQVVANAAWVSLSPSAGTIPAGGSLAVTVALGPQADLLGNGVYQATVTFLNLTTGEGSTQRSVHLQVGQVERQVSFPMDTNPGWTMPGDWAFGVPLGAGGQYGGPDPTSGFTGSNLIGYNLAGDYANNLPPTRLVSTPIDCRHLTMVSVRYMRWLGVESPSYDHATFEVSNDGVNFFPVWTNTGEIADASWQQMEHDISIYADGQQTLYLAWTMGPTDESWRYCGWNIDDVEIWGLDDDVSAVGVLPAAASGLRNHPNPFNPLTRIEFELAAPVMTTLRIYDLQGRLVRRLVDEVLPAGLRSAVWDGRDDAGRLAGSGVYLAILEAGGLRLEQKMVMIK